MADKVSLQELEQVESEWVSSPSPILCARFADLLRQSGRIDESLKIAEEGLKKWASNSSIAVVLGKAYFDAGLLEKSLEVFEKVRAMQPQNLVVLKSLAEIHYKREDWDRCITAYEEYLFENPSDEDAREMQEQARSMKGTNIEELFETGTSEGEAPALSGDTADDDDRIFPDTDRMKKVLESQGYGEEDDQADAVPGSLSDEPSEEDPDEEGSEEEDGYPIEADSIFDRSSPASLLEFFTDGEKEELKLDTYDSED